MASNLSRWDEIISAKAKQYGLDPAIVRAVIWQESRGNPNAVSPVGAQGLMQLMPGTAKDLGVKNSFDPVQNIDAGVRYLKQNIDKYGVLGGLAAYNAGPGNVEKYGGLPPFKETRNYVKNIITNLNSSSFADAPATPLNTPSIPALPNQSPQAALTMLRSSIAQPSRMDLGREQAKNFEKNFFGEEINLGSGKPMFRLPESFSQPITGGSLEKNFSNLMRAAQQKGQENIEKLRSEGTPESLLSIFEKGKQASGYLGNVMQGGLGTVEGALTPENILLALATKKFPQLSKPIAAAYAPKMIEGTYQQGKQAIQDFQSGNTNQGITDLTKTLLSGVMTGAAVKHAGLPSALKEVGGTIKSAYENLPAQLKEQTGAIRLKDSPVPERPQTLDLQIQSLQEGNSKSVLVTPGESMPRVPEGMKTLETKVGTWIYNPAQLKPFQIRRGIAKGEYGDLLGYVEPKSPQTTQTVSAIQNGIEAKTAVTSPENLLNQAEILKSQFPQAEIKTGGPELAQQVINDRVSAGKERGFVTTVKESPMSPKPLAEGVSGTYDVLSNADTMARAQQIVQANPIQARDLVLNSKSPTAETYATGMELIRKFNAEGDFTQSIQIANHIARRVTDQGQAIQALSMYDKLGPDGILRLAAKTVEDAQNNLPPVKQKILENKVNEVTKKLNDVNKQAADQVAQEVNTALNKSGAESVAQPEKNIQKPKSAELINLENFLKTLKEKMSEKDKNNSNNNALNKKTPKEKTPEQILAERVGRSADPKKEIKADPIKDMVGTLYQVAKEGLPKKVSVPKNPIKLIGDAIRKSETYKDVWGKAQEIVKNKYRDNPEAIVILEKFIRAPLDTPYAKRQLATSMQMGMKSLDINIGDIVREHYSRTDKAQIKLSERLVKQAGLKNENAAALAAEVTKRFNDLVTQKKAQVLAQIFREQPAKVIKGPGQRIIELSNLGAFDSNRYRSLVAEKLGIPSLTPEFAQKVTEQARTIQEMPEGRAKAVATAVMLRDIVELVPPSLGRKVATFQTIAQLLNPKTGIRNILGSGAFGLAENVKDVVATPIDRAVSLVTGQWTKSLSGFNQLGEQWRGFKEGLKEGTQEARQGIDLTQVGDKWEINGIQNGLPRGRTFKNGIMGGLERIMNVALRAPDRAFYQAAFNKRVAELKSLSPDGKLTPEMFADARMEALYKTFQDDSAAARVFSGIKKSLNLNKEFGVGDILLKYPKTPGNILSRSMAYSPAGFMKGVMELGKAALNKGFDQKAFVDSTSRALVGTAGFTAVGYGLSQLNLLRNSAPKDPDLRALEKTAGLGQSQLNVSGLTRWILSGFDKQEAGMQKGDTLVTYDWALPLSIPVSMGARAQEKSLDIGAGDTAALAAAGLEGGLETLGEQPLIRTFTQLAQGKSLPKSLTEAAKGIPASFTPTLLKQFYQLTDNTQRDVRDPNPLKMAANMAIAKTPFAGMLPSKVDPYGKPMEVYQGGTNSILNVMFNPSFVSRYEPTPETKMVMDLYKSTNDARIVPIVVEEKFKFNGIPFEMKAKQRNFMQRWVGERTQSYFSKLANSPDFMRVPDQEKVKILTNYLTDVRAAARAGLFLDTMNQLPADQRPAWMAQQVQKNKLSQDQVKNLFRDIAKFQIYSRQQ